MSEEPPLIGPAAGALMAVVGVVAFCALLVLLTYASSLETGNNGGGHALSKSAIGFSGLAQALRDLNEPVLISRHRLPEGKRRPLCADAAAAGGREGHTKASERHGRRDDADGF